ncbi:MAG: hypothetical protein EBR01_12785 [Proteobacteria bacterium]|nr:hypothetical protein [Pseudomonadota bacterium]
MVIPPISNIAVKPNIWFSNQKATIIPYFLQDIIPGDLLVQILQTNDIRVIRQKLNVTQLYEYQQSIFFQEYGQQ